MKSWLAARSKAKKIFPYVQLEIVKSVNDRVWTKLWVDSMLWTAEIINRSATSANAGLLSPYEVFYKERPPMPLLIFFQPLYHRIPQQRRTEPRARPCLFLNFGYNHGLDSYKILDATTGMVVYSRDVT